MTWTFARPADRKRVFSSSPAARGSRVAPHRADSLTGRSNIARLNSPVLTAMFLSALYGGYYQAVTGLGWQDVASTAYWSANFQLARVGEFLITVVGLQNHTVLGPLGDIIAMVIAGVFAFCAGIGGAAVQSYSMLVGT